MRKTDKYTFFWKSKLSQWNMQSFKDNQGIEYNCAEQYMMAKKALLFNDEKSYKKIMNEKDPSVQQDLGRKVKNFDLKVWNGNAMLIVYQANLYKFEQNQNLLDMLMDTGNTLLVEASPFDPVWGVKLGENDDRILDEKNWNGTNWLGYVLTNLRDNYFKSK